MTGAIAPAAAQTLPSGPSVAAGAASVAMPSGTSLVIDQTSAKAVINWDSFSIGKGNSVAINNGGGATLNRVVGNIPSRIDGSLTATGSVYLVNPAGVAVGPTGRILAGGSFIASTLDVPDAAFLSGGDKTFSGTSRAMVTNAGSIGALGGDVALIAREVRNDGTIAAPNGTVGLAAGFEVLVRDGAVEGGKFQVRVGGADTAARTAGRITAAAAEIRANGGNVYALAGNTGGVIAATGTATEGGRIYLTAGGAGTVAVDGTVTATRAGENGTVQGGDIRVAGGKAKVAGTLSAKGQGAKGGTVAVTGTAVTLTGTATVDATGSRGGTVAVGGDYQGGRNAARRTLNEEVANARTTAIAAGARLSVDGTAGDGGSVVVWSDERTDFAGAITARGAGAGGNGGNAEVSGKAVLSFRGTADLTAAAGRTGTLLLDPYNLTISAVSPDSTNSGLTAAGDDSVLSVSTLTTLLGSANVAVSTGTGGSQAGDITVAAPVAWSADTVLTLAADGDIAINASITASGAAAGLVLQYGAGKGYGFGRGGSGTGSVTLSGANATLRIGEAGALQSYTLIHDMAALDAIDSTGPAGRYALAQNLDAAGTTYAGALVSTFTGTFAGLGNTIANLTIDAPTTDYIGLFGTLGSGSNLRDIGLVDPAVTGKTRVGGVAGATLGTVTHAYVTGGSVTGTERVGGLIGSTAGSSAITQSYATGSVSGVNHVGGLVGWSQGRVTQSHATGSATGTGERIGGLLGYHSGTVTQSYATGAVSGDVHVGGLAGWNQGAVTQSHATGSVTGTGESVGGLVGWNYTAITESYATGNVAGDTKVGGLVGDNYGDAHVSQSYATGNVSGNNDIGGLVGWHQSGTVTQSHASGSVTGTDDVGGLAGFNSATITASYAAGTVTGNRYVGGLVGWNQETITQSHATGTVTGNGEAVGGLVGFTSVTVAGSYATGNVTGSGDNFGGLAGSNYGTVTESHATGAVTVTGNNVGGLLGVNGDGTVTQSHATGSVSGTGDNVGGLVGASQNGTVDTVYATGAVSGASAVGGLIGDSQDDGVARAYATGAVNGASGVGGLIGRLRGGSGALSESYATGAVTATENKAGGLLGGVEDASATNVYATGSVTGDIAAADGEHVIGGLVGDNHGTISNAYATGRVTLSGACTSGDCQAGGFAGRNGGSIGASYWDKSTTGQAGSPSTEAGLTGLTTAEFQDTASFMTGASGWDFDTVWAPPSSGYYPVLYATTPVTWVKAVSTTSVYGSGSGTVTAVTARGAPGAYVFGKADDSLSLTGGTVAADPLALVSATPVTTSVTAANTTVTSAKGTTYRVFHFGDSTLTVTPAALTITADAARKTYGDVATLTGYSVSGLKNGDSVSSVSLSSTGTAATAGVGSYDIAASSAQGTGLSNYTIGYSAGTLTVTPAVLTITADAARKTYGDAATLAGYSVSGLKNGDSVSSVSLSSTGTAATAGVGSYDIAASSAQGTGLSNYTIGYSAGTLTVTPAALTITADAARKTYGDVATLTGYSVSGLKNGDSVSSVSLSSTGTAATAGVGSYDIAASSAQGTGLSNYTIGYSAGTLTVTPAALTITADAARKTYGDVATLTGYSVSGLKNGDSVSSVSLSSTGTAATAGVGSYDIAASSAQGTGLSNYTIGYSAGTLTVTPAVLTITADAARKTYGDVATLAGYSVSGLKNGDSVSSVSLSSTGTAATAGVGGYDIAASSAQGTGLSNYTIGYTAGTLTVTPRSLIVTADAVSRLVGTANPALTYSVGGQGLVNGDMLTGVPVTAATAAAPAGAYAITQGTLAASPNYSLTFNPAVLTVLPAGDTAGQPQETTPEELKQVLTSAALPRNLVVATASQVMPVFQSRDTPAPSTGSPAASNSTPASAAARTSVADGSAGTSGSQGTADGSAACAGGAATSGACTTTPHPENTRVGRFLRFSVRRGTD